METIEEMIKVMDLQIDLKIYTSYHHKNIYKREQCLQKGEINVLGNSIPLPSMMEGSVNE